MAAAPAVRSKSSRKCETGAAHICEVDFSTGRNDFRDAYAVAEAVQRPTTRFVPAKTNEQLDLQALRGVRHRLVTERSADIDAHAARLLRCRTIRRPRHLGLKTGVYGGRPI